MTSTQHIHRWLGPFINHLNGRQYMWCSRCEEAEYRPRKVQKIQQLNTLRLTSEGRQT